MTAQGPIGSTTWHDRRAPREEFLTKNCVNVARTSIAVGGRSPDGTFMPVTRSGKRGERQRMRNRATRRRATKAPPSPRRSAIAASVRSASVDPAPDGVEPEALVVTHYIDPSEADWPGQIATIRLTGRRVGAHGDRDLRDVFTQEQQIDGMVPGGGPTSVTTRVFGLVPGQWDVAAELLPVGGARRNHRANGTPIRPAQWSWRHWAVSAAAPGPVTTRWSPLAQLARTPGVIPGIWPILGILGVGVALILQRVMLPHEGVAVDVPLWVPLAALASGLVAAKGWYAALHPGPWRQAMLGGWAVDGFLVAAPVVAVAILVAFNLPVGAFLDAVTPGLFVAVAIGRIGCFLAGCCAGRATSSRWGIASSDRMIFARRIPAQILEAAAGLLIAAVSMTVILGHLPHIDGSVFIGALGVYFLARQFLLRVRAERREFLWRRQAI